MTTTTLDAPPLFRGDKFEIASIGALLGFVVAAQVSIAAAGIMLFITVLCWATVLMVHHERVQVPAMFWMLAAYGVATVVSALASKEQMHSLVDCKQLVLYLIVPVVYRFARGPRAVTLTTVIISVGALTGLYGIIQYGLLHYDTLDHRAHGTLNHYMTYSGVLMLVTCAAASQLLFGGAPRQVAREEGQAAASGATGPTWTPARQWTALVTPTLLIAQALTLTRSAWLGVSVGLMVLFSLTNRKLLVLLPVGIGLFLFLAPHTVSSRFYSIFDPSNPTNRDRVAMLHYGTRMVADHPFTGVGPDMVKEVYPQYRDEEAVEKVNFHLHNVPMQIAAERGLPALIIWIGFIVVVVRDLLKLFRTSRYPSIAAAGLAAVAAMLVAGLFEYNFGDSEFLMLFLVLITLPFAADRDPIVAETR